MGIAALVLGIIGTLVALIPVLGMYALPLALLAVGLGFFGRSQAVKKGVATAGIVLGVVAIGLAGFQYSLYRKAKSELTNPNSDFNRAVNAESAKLQAELKAEAAKLEVELGKSGAPAAE